MGPTVWQTGMSPSGTHGEADRESPSGTNGVADGDVLLGNRLSATTTG